MSEIPQRLPGLSNKREDELRVIYEQELGQPVPDEVTTVAKLTDAIKAHRGTTEAGSDVPAVAKTLADYSDEEVHAEVERRFGLSLTSDSPAAIIPKSTEGQILASKGEQKAYFTEESWALLKRQDGTRDGWAEVVNKPTDLH
jgi:hypothetical protein